MRLATLHETEVDLEQAQPRRFSEYSEYKQSGLDWIGKVPTRWTIERLRWSVLGCRNGIWGGEPDGINDIICVRVADFDRTKLVVQIVDPTFRAVTIDERKGRVLKKGGLLLEKSGGGQLQPVGAVVLYDHDVDAVCSNFIAHMPVAHGWDSHFLLYVHNHLYTRRVNTRSIKQTTGIQNLDSEAYLNERVPRPPLAEQQTIANFLDRETARIDELIEKKQRLVALIRPRWEALIDNALHSNATQFLRFGVVAKRQLRAINRDENEIYTPLGLFNRGRGIFKKDPTGGSELGDSSFFWVKTGDLILSGQFAWEGAVAYASIDEKSCIVSHRYPIYRAVEGIETAYLFAFLRTEHGQFLLTESSRGAAGRNRPLNSGLLEKEKIPIPCSGLQKSIVELVEYERNLSVLIGRSINRLREYRTALISAAVTGKVDVREVGHSMTETRLLEAAGDS